jgi:hypothetical protein
MYSRACPQVLLKRWERRLESAFEISLNQQDLNVSVCRVNLEPLGGDAPIQRCRHAPVHLSHKCRRQSGPRADCALASQWEHERGRGGKNRTQGSGEYYRDASLDDICADRGSKIALKRHFDSVLKGPCWSMYLYETCSLATTQRALPLKESLLNWFVSNNPKGSAAQGISIKLVC